MSQTKTAPRHIAPIKNYVITSHLPSPAVTSGQRRQCPSFPSVVFLSNLLLFPLDFLQLFVLLSPLAVSSTAISVIPKWRPL